MDSDTGRTYFWNPQTNATRWTLPGLLIFFLYVKEEEEEEEEEEDSQKLLLLVAALIVDSGSGMCQVGLSGVVPRAVFPLLVLLVTMHIVLCFLRLSRLLMKPVAIAPGAVLVQGDMPVVIASGAFDQTAQKTVEIPQLPFFRQARSEFCRGAEADSHGRLQARDARASWPVWTTRNFSRPSSMSFTCPLCATTGASGA